MVVTISRSRFMADQMRYNIFLSLPDDCRNNTA